MGSYEERAIFRGVAAHDMDRHGIPKKTMTYCPAIFVKSDSSRKRGS